MNIKQQINLFKRWYGMLSGSSVFHVDQKIGRSYSKKNLKGYYNDLTGKVTGTTVLDQSGIPVNTTARGETVYFPITIFQYGLGAYDLYLETKDDIYINKFMTIANWALEKQNNNGSWNCFDNLGDKVNKPFSAMCQGEGASILARAFYETKELKYYEGAIKAIDFMLLDVKVGGTTTYIDDYCILQEYVSDYNSSVLNGWIFAIFGLLDITKICDKKVYSDALEKNIYSLKCHIEKYDNGYWSNYDLIGTIASPAYHDLHIQQLELLYDLFEISEFLYVSKKWKNYQKRKINRYRAFISKAIQKLFFSKYDNGTSLIS